MKLYYSPGDCSLSPHIMALEAGVACELVRVTLQDHTLEDGSDFYAVNPLGYVPYLVLDDGQTLREGSVIAQYLADLAPGRQLMPTAGTSARWRMLEWLNFIATELHKNYSPLYTDGTPDDYKLIVLARLRQRYEWVEQQLSDAGYLLGEQFCVADAYLFTTLNWVRHAGLDLQGRDKLQAYHQRVGLRPAVQAAMQAENLNFLSI